MSPESQCNKFCRQLDTAKSVVVTVTAMLSAPMSSSVSAMPVVYASKPSSQQLVDDVFIGTYQESEPGTGGPLPKWWTIAFDAFIAALLHDTLDA
jgi:Na+/H+ antiporter NhaD/arsenite permease-like protein